MTRIVICPDCSLRISLHNSSPRMMCDKCGKMDGIGVIFYPIGGRDMCGECFNKQEFIELKGPAPDLPPAKPTF